MKSEHRVVIALHQDTNDLLNEVIEVRKAKEVGFRVTKRSVLDDLIRKAHKRECK